MVETELIAWEYRQQTHHHRPKRIPTITSVSPHPHRERRNDEPSEIFDQKTTPTNYSNLIEHDE